MDPRTQERLYEEEMGRQALKRQVAETEREKHCTCTAHPKWAPDGHAIWCPAYSIR